MRPYRTIDNKIDGVVITFVDVTERKSMEERLKALIAWALLSLRARWCVLGSSEAAHASGDVNRQGWAA
jgi:hypothetical protein